MMGNKKRAEIRDELAQELDRTGLEPTAWYEQQLQKLQTNAQPDPADRLRELLERRQGK
jgi:hypothetical protein